MISRAVIGRGWRGLVLVGSAGAAALTSHSILNLQLMRRPADRPAPVTERVSVLLPLRNEAARAGPCLASLQGQQGLADAEILILDDQSTDATQAVVQEAVVQEAVVHEATGQQAAGRRAPGSDARISLRAGTTPPEGWLGKPHACHQLASAATGSVLVFIDADVRLAPHAIAAAVGLLRDHRLDLVSPYPRQIAKTPAERLIQPLLQWSWLTTLSLRVAERSARPSMAAANGQFLVVDAHAYRKAGGHAAIRNDVLDDVALLRRIKAAGGAGGMADGTSLATCRMYESAAELREGYRKSLWSAFGSPASAAGAMAVLIILYVVPPLGALTGSITGLGGYLSAVAGRYLIARRTQSRTMPDVLAHPVSIAALVAMTASSFRGRRRGDLTWRGRPVHAASGSTR